MLGRCLIAAALAGTIWTTSTGCSFQSNGNSDDTTDPGPLTVKGQAVDFLSGAAVVTTDITISELSPLPMVDRQGAAFTLTGVAPNSAFDVLAVAAGHRSTLSQVVVTTSDLDGVKLPVVSESFLTSLATTFGVAPSPSKGIVLLHLLDSGGKPRAGVAAIDFTIAGTAGPRFLDPNLMPATGATTSSSSGWVVFFDVPVGLAGLSQSLTAATTIDMPTLPVAAGVVTIAEAKVVDGAPVLPSQVLFSAQIVPIFAARGCTACHAGSGAGKQQGNLMLSGGDNLVYRQLVTDRPGIRVNLAMPEKSLVLTMPSRETPPDAHPTVVFTGPRDPDYLKLLVWIREGAKQN
jgi:hypothetical protein